MKKILIVVGTRPEAIKLLPVAYELQQNKHFESIICLTGQHQELQEEFFNSNEIGNVLALLPPPMSNSHAERVSHIMREVSILFSAITPDLIVVQGDTSSAFVAALTAQYHQIPIAHVEAGLRTHTLSSPWPEEMHRVLIDKISDFFFVPTLRAYNNLINENVAKEKIWLVGNTSIDAVRIIMQAVKKTKPINKKNIVVTLHRHENRGKPISEVCSALNTVADSFREVKIKFCLHQNPAAANIAINHLSGKRNIDLLQPQSHRNFIQLLYQSTFIITDSGGIQEEATYLGKPVLITRSNTERQESVEVGNGIVTGTEKHLIINHCRRLLENKVLRENMSKTALPYGPGYASKQIVSILEQALL